MKKIINLDVQEVKFFINALAELYDRIDETDASAILGVTKSELAERIELLERRLVDQ